MCIACGHCEAYCPSQAFLLNVRPDEKEHFEDSAGAILCRFYGGRTAIPFIRLSYPGTESHMANRQTIPAARILGGSSTG